VRLKVLLCCGGTKPKPEAPTTTPLDSSIASGGEGGNTTGPAMHNSKENRNKLERKKYRGVFYKSLEAPKQFVG